MAAQPGPGLRLRSEESLDKEDNAQHISDEQKIIAQKLAL